jgi:phosphoserine phosphatase
MTPPDPALAALLRALADAGHAVTLTDGDGTATAECVVDGHRYVVRAGSPMQAVSELAVRLGWDLE